eukprot:symbB.v1.2.017938.t2/scaffold1408.1/size121891/2
MEDGPKPGSKEHGSDVEQLEEPEVVASRTDEKKRGAAEASSFNIDAPAFEPRADAQGMEDIQDKLPLRHKQMLRGFYQAYNGEYVSYYVGTLKTYNVKNGYGFLECKQAKADWHCDVFVHKNNVPTPWNLGQPVEFAVQVNLKGQPQAYDCNWLPRLPQTSAVTPGTTPGLPGKGRGGYEAEPDGSPQAEAAKGEEETLRLQTRRSDPHHSLQTAVWPSPHTRNGASCGLSASHAIGLENQANGHGMHSTSKGLYYECLEFTTPRRIGQHYEQRHGYKTDVWAVDVPDSAVRRVEEHLPWAGMGSFKEVCVDDVPSHLVRLVDSGASRSSGYSDVERERVLSGLCKLEALSAKAATCGGKSAAVRGVGSTKSFPKFWGDFLVRLVPCGRPRSNEPRRLGTLKSYSSQHGYGFISCTETQQAYKRDVYLDKSQVGEAWQWNQLLEFSVSFNDRSQPQARNVNWEPVPLLSSSQAPPGAKRTYSAKTLDQLKRLLKLLHEKNNETAVVTAIDLQGGSGVTEGNQEDDVDYVFFVLDRLGEKEEALKSIKDFVKMLFVLMLARMLKTQKSKVRALTLIEWFQACTSMIQMSNESVQQHIQDVLKQINTHIIAAAKENEVLKDQVGTPQQLRLLCWQRLFLEDGPSSAFRCDGGRSHCGAPVAELVLLGSQGSASKRGGASSGDCSCTDVLCCSC